MNRVFMLFCGCLILCCILTGCSNKVPSDPKYTAIDTRNLPVPNMTLEIPGISSCTTMSGSTIEINNHEPLIIIVHGCEGSAARFRALAQVFAYHGQQAVCFNYDDRDSLMKSSSDLIHSIGLLSDILDSTTITVIGHSLGGLISRKAFIKDRTDPLNTDTISFDLITISSPFAGIEAAEHCASKTAGILTLGLAVPLCKMISGRKWYEITHPSQFIQDPGTFIDQVNTHIKIVTDESETCRTYNKDGDCIKDDFVFSIREQYFDNVDSPEQVVNLEVLSGHVEIVGDYDTPPEKLIRLLQQKGIMKMTPPQQKEEFSAFLSDLY